MSESPDFSTVRRELRRLKRNAFNELNEAVTKINSDLELAVIELNNLEGEIVALIKELINKIREFHDDLEKEGEGRKLNVKLRHGTWLLIA